MRILMLSQFYPPIIGGEEQHVRNLSLRLSSIGHDVSVATLGHDGAPAEELDNGVHVHRLRGTLQRAQWLFRETGRRHAPPFADPEAMWALHRIISDERPDVVHAHNWFVHTFVPLKRWSGAGLVLTLHDYSLLCAKKRLMYEDAICDGPAITRCLKCSLAHYGLAKGLSTVTANWASGIAERAAVDVFLPVSQAVADGNGLPASGLPYEIIPNFLPDTFEREESAYAPYLDQLPASDFMLFAGDLSRQKGVDVLLRAYASLRQAPFLVLIGRQLTDSPKNLPEGARMFHDWPHGAIMAAWRRSILGVVPSVWPDPCPTVALEAMASGRPVIASRIGGLVDQVADGETGYLVPAGDVDGLREAMQRLIEDPVLREDMGRAGLHRVSQFQSHSVVPRIEEVYRRVAHAAPCRDVAHVR